MEKPEGTCSENLYTGTDFLDWEAYLDIHSPDFRGKRCDLIHDTCQETTIFIEHKARDWFDPKKNFPEGKKETLLITDPIFANSLLSKFYAEAFNSIKAKIEDTIGMYKNTKGIIINPKYVLVFSKKHSIGWKSAELTDSQIKNLARTRILDYKRINVHGFDVSTDLRQCDCCFD